MNMADLHAPCDKGKIRDRDLEREREERERERVRERELKKIGPLAHGASLAAPE